MMQAGTNSMPDDALTQALKKRRQISITVTGRRTGRAITRPVWFVFEENTLWLLPVSGSRTQWYRNLQKNRAITIQAGREQRDLRARLLKNAPAVRQVIRRFRDKYTAAQVKRWLIALVHRPRCRSANTASGPHHLNAPHHPIRLNCAAVRRQTISRRRPPKEPNRTYLIGRTCFLAGITALVLTRISGDSMDNPSIS
jgi:deazaflavin-dependent oxidoreductase (nitroreductase family)